MKIPFSPPWIDDDVRAEVMQSLDSGWITTGPKVRELERLTSELTGTSHTLCCNSATSALMLAMHWFGISRGDEVIIPAYTYAATALTVLHLGAVPVMVDTKEDFTIDVDLIRKKITSKTKAIIPVDIAGWPCDYQAILDLVKETAVKSLFHAKGEQQIKLGRLLVLADSAHSVGAIYKNKPLGTWADLTVFSFHAVKNITTAEGGTITIGLPAPFDHDEVYKTFRLWSLNGQTKDAFTKSLAGGWKYDIVYPGFKMNMPDICAAIGVAQIRKYKSFLLPERKKLDAAYRQLFSDCDWVQLPPADKDDIRSSYHLFALRIKGISEEQRDKMMELIAAQEVSVNVHFQPLPLLTVFKERGYTIADYPKTYDSYSREISLPIYPGLKPEEVQFIVDTIKQSYRTVVNG